MPRWTTRRRVYMAGLALVAAGLAICIAEPLVGFRREAVVDGRSAALDRGMLAYLRVTLMDSFSMSAVVFWLGVVVLAMAHVPALLRRTLRLVGWAGGDSG